jgi:iron complex outermembrane receptor protein
MRELKRRPSRSPSLHLASFACALGLASAVGAAEETSGQLEEVVVTALKRDQVLQEVPASITAFTAETLERSNITRPIDFINATPNLTAVEANNAGDLRITIRGDAQALNTDAPVAVVVDGVVLTGATGLNKDLLDVQQIEVLKGPQGYLYGRNAISGAINIVTAAPGDEFAARGRFGFGNGDTATAAFSASGPLVTDRLGVSFAAGYRDSDGFYFNDTLGENVDPYTEKSGRLRLDWTPNEALRVQGSVFIARIDGSATNYLSQSRFAPLQTSSPIVDANFAEAPFVHNIANFNRKEDDLIALRLDYDLPGGRITSVSSYESQDNRFASDGYPYTPGGGEGTQWNQREHTARTTELRFTSPSERRLRYIFGAYYADISQTPFLLAAVGVDDAGIVRRQAPPIRSGANQTTGFSADNVDAEAWAAFANFDFDLTDALTLTLAGRYDDEDKEARDVAFGASSVTGLPFSATAGVVRGDTFSKFQPKASFSWEPNEDQSYYATYAVGFKAGGFNAAQAFTITNGRAPNQYPAEEARNFEIGAKTQWLDRRLTLNGAIFRTEKDNSQLFQFIPQGFLNAVTVIDRIRVTGGELELAARASDRLTIRSGIGYTDAEITQYRSNPRFVDNDAPYVPDIKSSLDATYEAPLSGSLTLVLNGRWDHIGRINFDARNSPEARRSALDLFAARASLEGERWTLSIWGRNLSDERYNSDIIVIFDDPANPPGLPFTQAVFKAPPRTYGVEIGVRF